MTSDTSPAATDRWPFLRATSPVPTWVGLAVAGVGFALQLLAWGRVAAETTVTEQLPHVGLGLVSLAFIMVGLVIVTVQSKRHDAVVHQRQLDQLTGVLAGLLPSDADSAAARAAAAEAADLAGAEQP